MLEGLMVLIAVATLIVALYSDAGSTKGKNSSFFLKVQKPTGKKVHELAISDFSENDGFFTKLNSL